MRQLFKNGQAIELSEQDSQEAIRIAVDTPLLDIQAQQLANSVLWLEFASSADGRGYSLAKILKRTLPATTKVVATGESSLINWS